MGHRFTKHYTREEASALLPKIRQWLEDLSKLGTKVRHLDGEFKPVLRSGVDLGGDRVSSWVRAMIRFQEILGEFERGEIQLKDIERGLIDFQAFVGGKEVFLCWEKSEKDVEFWHDLDTGFAGRECL